MFVRPEVNCYYQHRYGGLYIVQDIATSTVDKTEWVVYSHCYPFQYQTWIRPYHEWTDGRFRKLTNEEYDEFLSRDVQQFQNEITAARELAKR